MSAVTFSASVYKAESLVDGGWRVTFDVPESDTSAVTELTRLRGRRLQIGVVEYGSELPDLDPASVVKGLLDG